MYSTTRRWLSALAICLLATPAHAVVFNLSYDPVTVQPLPNFAQIQTATNFAAQQLGNLYSDPITINISVQASPSNAFLGQSSTNIVGIATYAGVRNALIADHTTANDATANASLDVIGYDAVPEPSTYRLLMAAALGLFLASRAKWRNQTSIAPAIT